MGVILAPQGIQGAVRVKSFTQEPLGLIQYSVLYTTDESELHPQSGRLLSSGNLVVKFKEIATRTDAEAFKNQNLYIKPEQLRPLEAENDYYYQDLQGLRVEDRDGNFIGTVQSIQNFGAGDVLEISLVQGGVQMLSFMKDAVLEVRLSDHLLIINPNYLC